MASTITYFSNFVLVTLYCSFSKDLKDSFFFPNKETVRELGDYLRIGIPSATMLCLEWWSLEVLALMAGYIDVLTTASFVIVVNTFCVLGMFSFGAGIAASVCVGKAIGEGDAPKAMQYGKLIITMTFFMIIMISAFLYEARFIISSVFTNIQDIQDKVVEAYKIIAGTLIIHGLGLV